MKSKLCDVCASRDGVLNKEIATVRMNDGSKTPLITIDLCSTHKVELLGLLRAYANGTFTPTLAMLEAGAAKDTPDGK